MIFQLKTKAIGDDGHRDVRDFVRVASPAAETCGMEKQIHRSGAVGSGSTGFAALALLCLLAGLALLAPVAGAAERPDFRQYVTVKFDGSVGAAERSAIRQGVGARFETALLGSKLQQVSVPKGVPSSLVADALGELPGVDYAVASGTWKADDAPAFNDPFYPAQWALENTGQIYMSRFEDGQISMISGTPGADIGAPAAWAAIDPQALSPTTIGVIDTGVAYQHVDLAANIAPGGQDFYDGDGDPRDPNGHGTHVASIAAGVADDGIGTVGVDPWAKVLPLRAADKFGNFSWAAIEQATAAGLASGVRVFNGSFGGPDSDPAFTDIMRSNPQALFVFSSGNGGSDAVGDDHDAISGNAHRYPCDTDLPNVICVGSSNSSDAMSSFSDYGVKSVDLLAPGEDVYAAKPCMSPAASADDQGECPFDANASDPNWAVGLGGEKYAFQLLSGTSMASPVVSGAIALVWGKCPSLAASQVKRAIVSTVDPLPAVKSKVAWGGRLDVGAAIDSLGGCPTASDGTDWPIPPEQPEPPAGDGGGNGGGPTGVVPPKPPTLPVPPVVTPPRASTLHYSIVRPTRAKLGKQRTVTFRIRCNEACAAAVEAHPRANGVTFKTIKVKRSRANAGTLVIKLKLSRSAAKNVRALLAARTGVRLRLSVVVSDAFGAASKRKAFSIRLKR